MSVCIHLGFLHRGTEKLVETRPSPLCLGFCDRLDYVSMILLEVCYSLLYERSSNLPASDVVVNQRSMAMEQTRTLSHCLWMGCACLDIGIMSSIMWCFELRERLMDYYERLSGTRQHAWWIRPASIPHDLLQSSSIEAYGCWSSSVFIISVLQTSLLTNASAWSRLVSIGIVTLNQATSLNATGPYLRSCGSFDDERWTRPYDVFLFLSLTIPIGCYGDCFDRIHLRSFEMKECSRIVVYLSSSFIQGPVNRDVSMSVSDLLTTSLPSLIDHAKSLVESMLGTYRSTILSSVESPRGSFILVSMTLGNTKPQRLYAKGPCVQSLLVSMLTLNGSSLFDLVSILASSDVILGETDR